MKKRDPHKNVATTLINDILRATNHGHLSQTRTTHPFCAV